MEYILLLALYCMSLYLAAVAGEQYGRIKNHDRAMKEVKQLRIEICKFLSDKELEKI